MAPDNSSRGAKPRATARRRVSTTRAGAWESVAQLLQVLFAHQLGSEPRER